jgi:hypothetical protein
MLEITEVETFEETAYAEISAQLTAKHLAHEEALEARNRYRYDHPLPTLEVQARLAELQDEIDKRARELQVLLGPYAELKSRINGW